MNIKLKGTEAKYSFPRKNLGFGVNKIRMQLLLPIFVLALQIFDLDIVFLLPRNYWTGNLVTL